MLKYLTIRIIKKAYKKMNREGIKQKKNYAYRKIILFMIVLIIILLSLIYSKSNKSGDVLENNFEKIIEKNSKINFTANYDIILHGGYKSSEIKSPDGKVTLWHNSEQGIIFSQNLDVRGMHWPEFFIRLEDGRWLYDLQDTIQKNHKDFEVRFSGEKSFINELTSCFIIKGELNNTFVKVEQCYNNKGIMLYQNLSEQRGGAELIARNYKLKIRWDV